MTGIDAKDVGAIADEVKANAHAAGIPADVLHGMVRDADFVARHSAKFRALVAQIGAAADR